MLHFLHRIRPPSRKKTLVSAPLVFSSCTGGVAQADVEVLPAPPVDPGFFQVRMLATRFLDASSIASVPATYRWVAQLSQHLFLCTLESAKRRRPPRSHLFGSRNEGARKPCQGNLVHDAKLVHCAAIEVMES